MAVGISELIRRLPENMRLLVIESCRVAINDARRLSVEVVETTLRAEQLRLESKSDASDRVSLPVDSVAAASSPGSGGAAASAGTVPFATHGADSTETSGVKRYAECKLYEDGLHFRFDTQEQYKSMIAFFDIHVTDLNLKESIDEGEGPCQFDVLVKPSEYEIFIQNKAEQPKGLEQCIALLKLNHIIPETAFTEHPELA